MDPLSIIIVIILFLCIIALSWFAGTDAPYVATNYEEISKVLKKAGVKQDTLFYELGSGDGRIVFEAAKLGAHAIGIEQSWIRVWMSRWRARQLKLRNAHFYHGNIFDRQYFPADVVFIYLLTPAVVRLEEKLQKELRKSAKVITQTYHFKNWKPSEQIDRFSIYTQYKSHE